MLLVCGAAAGVAAIFKAPATGVVFALEVPYRQDLARRMLLPAMFAAAGSYVVFAAINGTTPVRSPERCPSTCATSAEGSCWDSPAASPRGSSPLC